MTAPARSDRRRRGVVVGPATAWASAVVLVGVSACGGGDGSESASDRGGGAAAVTTASTSPSTSSTSSASTSTTSAPDRAAETVPGVPGVPGEVTGPVPLDATAAVGNGVEVRLSRIDAVEAEAHLPGEVSGPAVAITVEILNGSGEPIDLDHVTVDLATAAGASASPVLDPAREPLAGSLDPGGTRSGSYVFTLGTDEREDVSVRVRYSVDTPTVVFTGGVPDG